MYFVLQTPPLQHLALVKISIALINQRDIFSQIVQTYNGQPLTAYSRVNLKEWKAIEEIVRSKASALSLPEAWKKQMLNFVKPLGMEIINWYRYHNFDDYRFQYLENLLPQQLCWTMHGTIDYAKTAELLIKDDRLSVERRYEIACLSCLEDEARELIRSIPEERRQLFIDKMKCIYYTDHHLLLIGYFTCTFNCNADQCDSHFQTMFSSADYNAGESSIHKWLFNKIALKCTRATCEYLFKKLDQEEKEQILREFQIPSIHLFDSPTCGLMYCWSVMNEEQQERTIDTCVYEVLICLLNWPMQSLFMEAAQCKWGFLDHNDFSMLLDAIVLKIRFDFKDCDYFQLFWECWRMSPDEYKQRYLSNMLFIVGLIQSKKEELFMKLLLKEAPLISLRQIITLFDQCDEIRRGYLGDGIISDAVLMQFKEAAALNSLTDPNDVGKKLRSELVSRLVDIVMERRLSERTRLV